MTKANTGNSEFTVKVSPKSEMRAFDKLPKILQDALNFTPLTMSAKDAQAYLDEGYKPEELVRLIKEGQLYWMKQDRDDGWPEPDESAFRVLDSRKKAVNVKQ